MFPTRSIRRIALISLGAVALIASSGCDNTKERLTALESENRDLRARIDTTDAAKRQAESEAALLREENNRLASQTTAAPAGGNWGADDYSTSRGSAQDVVITLAGDLLFESGQVVLKQAAKAKLDQVARDLNSQHAGHRIRVVGHTDSDPIRKSKWKSNDELSFARAQAVADYLASRNVSRGRLAVVGKGASEPKATKASSRRVEVIVLGN
ncbi:MAG: flagellar motor protein MotB [Phycisphaerales bacterium]